MKCPICRKEVAPSSPEMPFCSERCRLIDLGLWAEGEYRIPGAPADADAKKNESQEDE